MAHPSSHHPVPIGQLLLQAFYWFDSSLLLSLAAQGCPELTRAQSLLFAHLDKTGTRTSELARRIGVTRQSMHKTVRELEALGLVEQRADETNRSAKLVTPTEQGRDNIEAALRSFDTIEHALGKRIGQEQVATLRSLLEVDWGKPIVERG